MFRVACNFIVRLQRGVAITGLMAKSVTTTSHGCFHNSRNILERNYYLNLYFHFVSFVVYLTELIQ
jgi:hypothetical protein